MKKVTIGICSMFLCSSCSTIGQSFELGASLGSIVGGVATYAGQKSAGNNPSLESVSIGASIGLGVGLIASYLVHRSVEADRSAQNDYQMELQFGDLPPSPFLIPNKNRKRGK